MWSYGGPAGCDITMVKRRQGVGLGAGPDGGMYWFQNLNYEATSSLPVSLMSSLLLTEHMFRFWWIHTHVSTSPKPDPPPQAPPSVSLLLFVPQPAALSCMIWMSDSPANTFPQSVRCDSGRIGGWLMNSCLLSSSNRFHQLTGGCERLTAHGGLASAGLRSFRVSVVSGTWGFNLGKRNTATHLRKKRIVRLARDDAWSKVLMHYPSIIFTCYTNVRKHSNKIELKGLTQLRLIHV